ncbi:signal peptidase I [Aliidiomarina maris]|uniref:Signal peptidase I n=1 Tax=Aliidiomarina maris TaxID=531312 RepID=A0A327X6I0_9GAMM|nr:signal peptidase I [Aliidiomarina maris]RAK01483.1 signal peptidase I [Aliidiomarina maris]RUO28320.1 signal peptidase I [Aliidiomarina maris]
MTVYFSLFLVILTLVTGVVWAIDHFVWKPKRDAKVKSMEAQAGTPFTAEQREQAAPQSSLAEFAQAAFPILAFVLIMRSFLYEPFRIPSGSMMPTLLEGDFILVEKFRYGLRDPVWRQEFIRTGRPERGDIAVFKYPLEPDVDYIKRVVGLPGDRVIYREKKIYVQPADCAQPCAEPDILVAEYSNVSQGEFFKDRAPLTRLREQLDSHSYDILIDRSSPSLTGNYARQEGTRSDEWIVPDGHYFMLGDNRDNSIDSRYWGFVHEDLLVGRAVFIWMSFEFERDRGSWIPRWVPSNVRFERLGGIE